MIYNVEDKLTFKNNVIFGLQMMLSVFVATVLIANQKIENLFDYLI